MGHCRKGYLLQSVPLTDDPQAWPGLPGGSRSSGATGNPSSAETSENEGEGSSSKMHRAGLSMADQIARASSGPSPIPQEEGKKRLINLNGWSSKPSAEAGLENIAVKQKGERHLS